MSAGRACLVLAGGTHNPRTPPFEFLDRAFPPLVRGMGVDLQARLDRPGFHRAGGGRIHLTIAPNGSLSPIKIRDRRALELT